MNELAYKIAEKIIATMPMGYLGPNANDTTAIAKLLIEFGNQIKRDCGVQFRDVMD